MKTTEKQKLTVNVLLLILLALLFLSGTLMWSQHEQYHGQQGMGWLAPEYSQNKMSPYQNNLNK